jgi:hypothetical protein
VNIGAVSMRHDGRAGDLGYGQFVVIHSIYILLAEPFVGCL